MIIANGERRGGSEDGKRLLLLGMSRENINRLIAGKPILLRRETHGNGIPEGWEIAIIFGETPQKIMRELQDIGVVDPKTEVNRYPNNEGS